MIRSMPLLMLLAIGDAVEAKTAVPFPNEVRAFIDRRTSCDHFRGEDSPDPARARQISDALKRNCTGTDAQLARLRHRYSKNARVRAALRDYESHIEQ